MFGAACFLAALSSAGCSTTTDVLDEFNTDVTPRLQNNEPARKGATINDAAFNKTAARVTTAPYAGYVGPLRVNYTADRNEISQDLNALGDAVAPGFDPNEMVTIDFNNASLAYILKQLLGGALGVNYVAPDKMPGGINFRTETPIPKSRVLQVVRDLLARNSLAMKLTNGIYQIGTEGELAAIESGSAAGRTGEEVTRVVKLERGNAAQVIELARQILPINVSVMVASSSDSVVVRANPSDFASVQQLLKTLAQLAVGKDKVAIIPLSRSAPDAVATQLSQIYAPSLRGGEAEVTVIPLQSQQAVLVRTSDASMMRGIQALASQLDRSVSDVSDLRVIPLSFARATDIAPQLSEIFGSTTVPQQVEAEAPKPASATTGVRSRLRPPGGNTPTDNEDGTGLSVPGPALQPDAPQQKQNARPDQETNGKPAEPAQAATAPPQPGETRIVANPRTNTIIVYSTYSVYKRMRELVETLDVAQAQVVIEATVIEVELNDRLETGVQFFLRSHGIMVGSGIPDGSDEPASGGVLGFSGNVGSVSVDAVIKALRAVTALKVISSPYLTVVDRETARLVIGDQIPFASSSQTSNNAGNVTVTTNVKILDTGVVLEITPQINADNSVNLNVVQSVSSPKETTSDKGMTPTIATRDISSRILARSGRTVLLGGLIQDRLTKDRTGVPRAAEIPVLGGLFRQDRARAARTELVVLITPRVVRNSSEIESITRALQGSKRAAVYGDIKAK